MELVDGIDLVVDRCHDGYEMAALNHREASIDPAENLQDRSGPLYSNPMTNLARSCGRALVMAVVGHTPVRTVKVRGGRLAGARLAVDLRTEKRYWLGTYEPHVQRVFAQEIRAGSVVYDVGAHAGFLAVLAQRLAGPKGRVVAFEPNAEITSRLKQNLSLNSTAGADVIERPVTNRTSSVELSEGPTNFEWSLRPPPVELPREPRHLGLEATSIDEAVASGLPAPDVIKIDVEGVEHAVLEGAEHTLRQAHPTIVLELHAWGEPQRTLSFLAEEKYVVTGLDGGHIDALELMRQLGPGDSLQVIAKWSEAEPERN
jgi:FkbM family methyltransferase